MLLRSSAWLASTSREWRSRRSARTLIVGIVWERAAAWIGPNQAIAVGAVRPLPQNLRNGPKSETFADGYQRLLSGRRWARVNDGNEGAKRKASTGPMKDYNGRLAEKPELAGSGRSGSAPRWRKSDLPYCGSYRRATASTSLSTRRKLPRPSFRRSPGLQPRRDNSANRDGSIDASLSSLMAKLPMPSKSVPMPT